MEIKYCKCGSPMSHFEANTYEMCGGCKDKELQAARAERERLAEERKEQERIKREQEEAEKKAKEEAIKNGFGNNLKSLIGKTVANAKVTEWTNAGGIVPKAVRIEFTDETYIDLEQDEFADGCRGCYDYYQYLSFYVSQ